MSQSIPVAVVTGQHPFEVQCFHQMFRSLENIDAYVQHMEDFCASPEDVRDRYSAVVFYNFHMRTPTGEEEGWFEKPMRGALERLGTAQQGIVVLHHALLAFPDWEPWTRLTGLKDRKGFGYDVGQRIKVEVAKAHPVTEGLKSWDMGEETYTLKVEPEDSEVLLTTAHPKSMRALAWTRSLGSARVFCLQLGHDHEAYSHPQFRSVLRRGILWSARRT